jgi:hypothetical protein
MQILRKSTRIYPDAQLHMLNNIPVKLHDSRLKNLLSYVRRTDGWMDGRTDKGKSIYSGGSKLFKYFERHLKEFEFVFQDGSLDFKQLQV